MNQSAYINGERFLEHLSSVTRACGSRRCMNQSAYAIDARDPSMRSCRSREPPVCVFQLVRVGGEGERERATPSDCCCGCGSGKLSCCMCRSICYSKLSVVQKIRPQELETMWNRRSTACKGKTFTCRRIRCKSIEPSEHNEEGKRLNKFELLLDPLRGIPDFLLGHWEKALNSSPLLPLQLVKETICSTLFIVLFGILLYMDLAKLFKTQQFLELKFQEIITTTYTFPFLVSAVITTIVGCACIPSLRRLKAYQIFREEGPSAHFSKVGTPTMGGLYFIPVGAMVAAIMTRATSTQANGLVAATFAFAAIGFLDDILCLVRKHNYGLPGWCKLFLQPFPHLDFGDWYLPFTSFCFASMSNGVNLTDGLDGLAGGTAAAAFLGMSLALSQVYPAVAIFGVSMAGACIGFLVHNHHKAAVFMGDTGSLALGGALAAMAASTGMFFPLLICSGIFFVETVSVVLQVSYKKWTQKMTGVRRRLFRMAPIHHHFELGGVREPTIVAIAHAISCFLALLGGYVGILCLT